MHSIAAIPRFARLTALPLLGALIPLFPLGCNSRELTRPKAQKLLEELAEKDTKATLVSIGVPLADKRFDPSRVVSFQLRQEKGNWRKVYDGLTLTDAAKSYFTSVSPPAKGTWNDRVTVTLRSPVPLTIIEITGIAEAAGLKAAIAGAGPGVKEVKFQTGYALPAGLLELLGERYRPLGEKKEDECLVRLFDDGWRLEDCRLNRPRYE